MKKPSSGKAMDTREAFDAMADEQEAERQEFMARFAKATGFVPCAYCETPMSCRERTCWRERRTEMSE